ncbi:MAG: hypothetical protein ACXWTL_04880 [Methylobacter sp.]
MSNSNEASSADLRWVLAILIGIGLVIVGFYFFNFNSHILKNEVWWNVFQSLSADTGNWGTFGDYVGGILNPVIAAFAFYLIAETYKLQKDAYSLQKTELAETRKLLEVSINAQRDQIKLAALTALLNSNLTRIGLLESEKTQWQQSHERLLSKKNTSESYETNLSDVEKKIWEIESEIDELKEKNKGFERQIESLFEGQN